MNKRIPEPKTRLSQLLLSRSAGRYFFVSTDVVQHRLDFSAPPLIGALVNTAYALSEFGEVGCPIVAPALRMASRLLNQRRQ